MLSEIYPHIKYSVVLAYRPVKKSNNDFYEQYNTIFPSVLENTPPKYAIIKRNKWMLEQSGYVVTYVKYIVGGAARFKEMAEKKGKTVINIIN